MQITRNIRSVRRENGLWRILTDGPEIRLMFLTDDIIRVRASFDGIFDEESYALAMTAWEDRLDPVLGDIRKRITPIDPPVSETDEYYEFATGTLRLRMYRSEYGIELFNAQGETVYGDLRARAFRIDRQGRVYHYSRIDAREDCFYGFGETAGPLNKVRGRVRQAPRDAIGYDAALSSPLYKHIPFYIRMNRKRKHALGLFYHNTWESVFDMGCERSGYWPEYSHFRADGGGIDLFFINGPKMSGVVERYTDLTGKTAFCPMEALGYLGSTMYYTELPENCDKEILGFIDTAKRERIPVDNFHLSSGYTEDDRGARCVFTWNRKKFSDPAAFFLKMAERGVSVSPNVKPGMLPANPHYGAFDRKRAFVRTADGKASYLDRWWGGPGSFVDFTNPAARGLWKELLKKRIIGMGTASVWNDNCEYDSLDDRDARCDFDGRGGVIDKLKSVQPLMMAHTAQEAVHEARPGVRPFIICRSGFAGIQRYASTWAGDNFTSWDTLRHNIATVLGMGLSGVAINGCDIGGFWGPAPDAELFVRWVQNGIFQPRFSIHSCNTDNTVTEPWMYSGCTAHVRNAILLRYSLMPYLYSLLYGAHATGAPVMRPLVYEFQDDPACHDEGEVFMLGPYLLVANVVEPGQAVRSVYLPGGSDWYYWHDRKRFPGGTTAEVPVDLGTIPLFIRDNAVIPMTAGLTGINTGTIDNLHLLIASDRDAQFTLFEDDGRSYGYREGACLKTTVRVRAGDRCTVSFSGEGTFRTKVATMLLEMIRRDKGPLRVTVGGRRIGQFLHRRSWEAADEGWYYSNTTGSALIKYANMPLPYTVEVNFERFDLIGM
ncbi:MAG: DUF4968 domain-containing protein [Spirochaetes bacterium]|nr:DUF4968 domain-containing protein [Spirochaetota bacterium]